MTVHVLALQGECSIYRATELAQTLQNWLPGACAAGPAQLDLSAISELDSAGLQLLLSAQRSAQALGQPLQIIAASGPVQDTLALAALEHLLVPASPTHAP